MDRLRTELEALAARELDVDREAAQAIVSLAELGGCARHDLVPSVPAEKPGGAAIRQRDGEEQPGAGRDLQRGPQAGPDGAESTRGREGTSAEIEPLAIEQRRPAYAPEVAAVGARVSRLEDELDVGVRDDARAAQPALEVEERRRVGEPHHRTREADADRAVVGLVHPEPGDAPPLLPAGALAREVGQPAAGRKDQQPGP